jgi:chromate transporter
VWLRIGLLGFGGPAGQIALMHRELVERRHWIDEPRFLHALNYCMLLPGPEAQQLATYVGWLLHRTPGGLVAGTLFVLPGALAILGLSILYATLGHLPAVAALFYGLKAGVLALVIEALIRIGKRALTTRVLVVLAAAAFVAINLFDVAFPLIIAGAAFIGWLGSRVAPHEFPFQLKSSNAASPSLVEQLFARGALGHTQPSARRAALVLLLGLLAWAAPLVAVRAAFGPTSVWFDLGKFFSKAALVTFGGAYAVLAYVAQQAVENFQWLRASEMLDGLGLAETTPGPLILVVEFVGFLAAYRNPDALPPLLSGVLGAAITLWVTFVPCFVWIFLGGPYVEAVRGQRALHAALSSITACVVGVILNLSLWFSLHVLFTRVDEVHAGPIRLLVPDPSTLDPGSAALACGALVAVLRFHIGLPWVLGGCALIGVAWRLLLAR